MEKEIYRIADFCNIRINKTELSRIMERSSFKFMKENEDKFGIELHKYNYKSFIRKGKINSSKQYFSNKQFNTYTANFNKYLSEFKYLDEYNIENVSHEKTGYNNKYT